jgi:hypothetical protein
VDFRGANLIVSDDQNKTYDNTNEVKFKAGSRSTKCEEYKPLAELRQTALGAGGTAQGTFGVSLRVISRELDPKIKHFFFTATKVGERIENAKWAILVPR